MLRLILLVLLYCVLFPIQAEVIITSSDVYAQVLLIEKETELVKRHFNIVKQSAEIVEINGDIQPRHVWQKSYMLQMKLVVFRHKHHLDGLAPVSIEPREQLDSRYTWAQTQRILTEIRIIRKVLGIVGDVGSAPLVDNKKSVDVFNKLAHIEAEWDALTGTYFDSSYVFSQTLRLSEDVDMILRQLEVFDNAIPPAKNADDTPNDSLAQAFLVMEQVQRLQKLAGLHTTDFSVFRKTEKAIPSDVFNMVCLILAELQQIKDRVGLKHSITPAALYHEVKKPADVRQFLGYITNKLMLINHL